MINYDEFLNKKLVDVKPSGIRKFFAIAEEMDNVISLGVGEPDFLTPWHIRQVLIILSKVLQDTRQMQVWQSLETKFQTFTQEIIL